MEKLPDLFNELVQVVTDLEPMVALILATLAVALTRLSVRDARKSSQLNHEAQILNLHRQSSAEIRDIQRLLPEEVNDEDWVPSKDQERILRMYWYLIFDEWLWSKKLAKNAGHMWDNYYWHGVQSALEKYAFRSALLMMYDQKTTFFGQREEFADVINEIYRKNHANALIEHDRISSSGTLLPSP